MANVHFVNLNALHFSFIVNNKNHCIGVLSNCFEKVDVETLGKLSQCFIVRCVGIENIFDNQNLPTHCKKGDRVVFSMKEEYVWPDEIPYRIVVTIDEVYHFQNGMDNSHEPGISFYEYSLLKAGHFLDACQAVNSSHAGVCE
ncbi:hypothetical protein [Photorhabdus australis]|uniref:hypothetical protein n=1 Tax=Photorhabdus australis TaxID=286156 RepID=UPI00056CA6AC|nr:hypothetical protein [Photorhabdus australis]